MADRKPGAPCRAILTGATGGIGRAIAWELAGRTDWMILVGRNIVALHALQEKIGKSKAHVIAGDLTQEGTLATIDRLARQLGGANLLVNNAGSGDFHDFETQDAGAIRNLLDTNLLAPMLLTRRLLPLLKEADTAQIINIGSLFGNLGYPGFAAYGASKAGLRGFTQALRRELADTGITVRHFIPRATRTAINSEAVVALNRALKTAEDTPEHVARQFVQFLDGSAWETTVGAKEAFFKFINQMLPALPDKAIAGQLSVIRKHMPK
ncbi:MAG TPA: short chain dehydrogenase [Oxalobacteraceae bacterium]|nr:short chain dehydrogenase [Oxalobacteraceae bacterium]